MKIVARSLIAAAAIVCCAARAQAQAPAPAAMASEQLAVGARPYQVQVHSGGSGRYTVVFESGFGTDLRAWRKAAPPFILVGHSYGGLLMRAFAARHPQQVAGMVLVDPSDERFNPALRKLDAARAAEDDRQFASFVHTIQLDEPELVVAAVAKVIQAADTQKAQASR